MTPPPPPVRWVEVARWCMARDCDWLTSAQVGVLYDYDRRGDVDLSPRQAAWLATFHATMRLGDGEPAASR